MGGSRRRPAGQRVFPSFPSLRVDLGRRVELADVLMTAKPVDNSNAAHIAVRGLFYTKLDGETPLKYPDAVQDVGETAAGPPRRSTETDPGFATAPTDPGIATGFLIGLLVGEGHFGGDGRQPQVTLRMHTRHEETFAWLRRTYPGSALYGPYHHGGRSYFQWSARGRYLRDQIVPLVEGHRELLDAYTAARFDSMCERYGIDRHPAMSSAPGDAATIAGSIEDPSGG